MPSGGPKRTVHGMTREKFPDDTIAGFGLFSSLEKENLSFVYV
jgi:hypothetical protein